MPKSLKDIDALTRPDGPAFRQDGEIGRIGAAFKAHMEASLDAKDGDVCRVRQAMNHSLASPGKLVRGHLVLLVLQAWGREWRTGLELARGVEIVHVASLVVDDLPAMDDALLRRGAVSSHRAFGEVTAILASVALLAEAFEALARADVDADARSEAAVALARAIGPEGMCGGQQLDIEGGQSSVSEISMVHGMKTGALFAAAAEIGTIAAGITGPRRWLMSDFGMLLGKAFQELDDLVDRFGTETSAGKDVGQDVDKATLVSHLGGREAERHALEKVVLALECLAASGCREDDLEAFVFSLMRRMRARYCLPAEEV